MKGLRIITTICLVRHGETDWNKVGRLQGQEDIPLNDLGKQQANECGIFLKNDPYDVIVTSPLSRALETAQIIQSHFQSDILIYEDELFKERAFGLASGLTLEERRTKYPDKSYPNQELWEDFKNRIFLGIQEIHEQFTDKKVLLVAHGAVINCILTEISDGEIGSGKTRLFNACISHIEHLDQVWNVKSFNETHHLSQVKK